MNKRIPWPAAASCESHRHDDPAPVSCFYVAEHIDIRQRPAQTTAFQALHSNRITSTPISVRPPHRKGTENTKSYSHDIENNCAKDLTPLLVLLSLYPCPRQGNAFETPSALSCRWAPKYPQLSTVRMTATSTFTPPLQRRSRAHASRKLNIKHHRGATKIPVALAWVFRLYVLYYKYTISNMLDTARNGGKLG